MTEDLEEEIQENVHLDEDGYEMAPGSLSQLSEMMPFLLQGIDKMKKENEKIKNNYKESVLVIQQMQNSIKTLIHDKSQLTILVQKLNKHIKNKKGRRVSLSRCTRKSDKTASPSSPHSSPLPSSPLPSSPLPWRKVLQRIREQKTKHHTPLPHSGSILEAIPLQEKTIAKIIAKIHLLRGYALQGGISLRELEAMGGRGEREIRDQGANDEKKRIYELFIFFLRRLFSLGEIETDLSSLIFDWNATVRNQIKYSHQIWRQERKKLHQKLQLLVEQLETSNSLNQKLSIKNNLLSLECERLRTANSLPIKKSDGELESTSIFIPANDPFLPPLSSPLSPPLPSSPLPSTLLSPPLHSFPLSHFHDEALLHAAVETQRESELAENRTCERSPSLPISPLLTVAPESPVAAPLPEREVTLLWGTSAVSPSPPPLSFSLSSPLSSSLLSPLPSSLPPAAQNAEWKEEHVPKKILFSISEKQGASRNKSERKEETPALVFPALSPLLSSPISPSAESPDNLQESSLHSHSRNLESSSLSPSESLAESAAEEREVSSPLPLFSSLDSHQKDISSHFSPSHSHSSSPSHSHSSSPSHSHTSSRQEKGTSLLSPLSSPLPTHSPEALPSLSSSSSSSSSDVSLHSSQQPLEDNSSLSSLPSTPLKTRPSPLPIPLVPLLSSPPLPSPLPSHQGSSHRSQRVQVRAKIPLTRRDQIFKQLGMKKFTLMEKSSPQSNFSWNSLASPSSSPVVSPPRPSVLDGMKNLLQRGTGGLFNT